VLEKRSYNEGTANRCEDRRIKPEHLARAGPRLRLLRLAGPPQPCSVEGFSFKTPWLLLLATASLSSGKRRLAASGGICALALL